MSGFKKIIIIQIILFIISIGLNAQEKDRSIEQIFNKVSKSVVKVYAIDFSGIENSQGSGVVIDQGIVVTNYHVFDGNEKLEIEHFGNRYTNIKILFADPENDLLGLKVYNFDLPPIEIIDSESDLFIGMKIYAIGSPKGWENTITDGIISGLRESSTDNYRWIQVTAGITHGSSGGAVVNEFGKLIGISTLGDLSTNININFALPVYFLKNRELWCSEIDELCLEKLAKYCLAYNLTSYAEKLIILYPTHSFEKSISEIIELVEESFKLDAQQVRNKKIIFEIIPKFPLTENHIKKVKGLSKYFGDGFNFFIEGIELVFLKKNFFASYDKFIQAISKEPDNPFYFYFLSLSYSMGGHTELAYKNLMKARQLGNRDAERLFEKSNYPIR